MAETLLASLHEAMRKEPPTEAAERAFAKWSASLLFQPVDNHGSRAGTKSASQLDRSAKPFPVAGVGA